MRFAVNWTGAWGVRRWASGVRPRTSDFGLLHGMAGVCGLKAEVKFLVSGFFGYKFFVVGG